MKQSQSKSGFPLLQWFGIVSLSLLIVLLPYNAGLYNGFETQFEMPQQLAMILTFIVLCISSVYLLPRWKFDGFKSILSIWMLAIPLSYLLSSFHPVSVHGAHTMVLISAMFSTFFILALYYGESFSAQKFFSVALTLSVYGVVIYGLFNMFGQIFYPDALWFTDGQYRLASVFQYSNTYAGFLSAVLMVCFYWITTLKKWYWLLVHSLMLVPISVSILLTLSRGALVIIPILVIIFLLFSRIQQQITALASMLITAVITLVILGTITDLYNQIAVIVQPQQQSGKLPSPVSIFDPLPMKGWFILFTASIIAFALLFAVHRWLAPLLEKRFTSVTKKSSMWIPGIVFGIGALLIILLNISSAITDIFPSAIAKRIENINLHQHSVLERGTFYRDAMKVVRDYPFLGTGGGGWNAIYQHYQNNPYSSREVHSFLIQTLIEIGWIGFFFFVLFLALVYFLYVKVLNKKNNGISESHGSYHFVFFIFSVSLFIHSFIDFDMSYSYFGILFYMCLGLMLAPFTRHLSLSIWDKYKNVKSRYVYPAVLLILSISLLIWSTREYTANRSYKEALTLAPNHQFKDVLVPMDRAIQMVPSNPNFSLVKIQWLNQAYQQTQDTKYLDQIKSVFSQLERFEPNNENLIMAKYQYYKAVGDTNQYLKVIEEGIRTFPWNITCYQTAIQDYAGAGGQVSSTDPSHAQYWNRGLELYHEVIRRTDQLKSLPKGQLQGRMYNVTPYMRQAIGSIYYDKKDFPNALATLEPLKQENMNDPLIRIGVRYYLASMNVLGKQDENLYKLLIAADPKEKSELEGLYQSNAK